VSLNPQDRLAIHELLALHGHLMDDGALDRLAELFSEDVSYDLEDFELGVLHGVAAVREAALAVGERNPVGHHVTNVIILSDDGAQARVRSKGIGVLADGSCGSVTYEDVVRREPSGWRISYRKVVARRRPLGG
jgi:3-phenylpropionate/cinnamic acid dioxygenase small subunit